MNYDNMRMDMEMEGRVETLNAFTIKSSVDGLIDFELNITIFKLNCVKIRRFAFSFFLVANITLFEATYCMSISACFKYGQSLFCKYRTNFKV